MGRDYNFFNNMGYMFWKMTNKNNVTNYALETRLKVMNIIYWLFPSLITLLIIIIFILMLICFALDCDPMGLTFMVVILIALVIGIFDLFLIPLVNKKRKLGNK